MNMQTHPIQNSARPNASLHPAHAEASASLYGMAKEVFVEFDGDLQAALPALVRRATSRPELLAAIIRLACWNDLTLVSRHYRDRVWTGNAISSFDEPPTRIPSPRRASDAETVSHRDRVTALASSNLLMFPLPTKNGRTVALGGAMKADVIEAASFYLVRASGMAAKHRWLSLIAERLRDGEKVRDVLDKDDLKTLKNKAGDHE